MWEQDKEQLQRSPLEIPMAVNVGKMMPLQHIVTVVLRAAGAQICSNRSAKGNLVRKLHK